MLADVSRVSSVFDSFFFFFQVNHKKYVDCFRLASRIHNAVDGTTTLTHLPSVAYLFSGGDLFFASYSVVPGIAAQRTAVVVLAEVLCDYFQFIALPLFGSCVGKFNFRSSVN